MGPSLQWRDENTRRPLASGEDVRIGSGRGAADGYLAHSQRVGPGVVILAPTVDDEVRALGDHCRDEGFTALAPDLTGGDAEDVARSAAEMLVANWHPRVGILALPGTEALAVAVEDRIALDAVVVAGTQDVPAGTAPRLAVDATTEGGVAEALDFLAYHLS